MRSMCDLKGFSMSISSNSTERICQKSALNERASNMRGRLAWRVNARPQNVLTVQALRVVAALLKGFLEPWRVVQAQFLRWGYLRGQSAHHFGARRQNSMKAASEPT
jgi:hypothetical protein